MPAPTPFNSDSNTPETRDAEASATADDGAHATGANLTWAQALNDARALLVQQSARIKADAQKIKAQQDEITRLRAALEAGGAEVQRLRGLEPQLADALVAREHAEALAGRQRLEIDSLETATRELQRMLGEQSGRIGEMATELQRLRASVPTDEDAAALESMAALLANARSRGKRLARPASPTSPSESQGVHLSGPGLARQQRDQRVAEARERELREQELREQIEREVVEITIPAIATPFSQVAARRAA